MPKKRSGAQRIFVQPLMPLFFIPENGINARKISMKKKSFNPIFETVQFFIRNYGIEGLGD